MSRFRWADVGRASADLIGHLVANSELLTQAAVRDFEYLKRDASDVLDVAKSELGALGATFRASPRYLRLASLGAAVVTRQRIAAAHDERTGRSDALGRAHRRNAVAVREACEQLGGGILKVGQLLSARSDLLPTASIDELRALQDNAPSVPFEAIESTALAELGAPISEIFEHVESSAIAAASLAQVHAARLRDGTDVVIKVQRPGVAELVRADLSALTALARVFRTSLPGFDVETIALETSRFLEAELDFSLEAERLKHFAKLAAADSRWYVPRVYRAHRQLIVMERIRGRSLSQFLDRATRGEVARVLSLLVEVLASGVLRDGAAHGDPHPGNILIEPSGRVVFVDFGCVLNLEESVRRAYVSLVAAVVSRQPQAIADALQAAGFYATDPSALVALAHLFLEAFEPGRLATLDPSEQIEQALRLTKEAGDVVVPASFVLIARIVALVGGLVLHHGANLDLFSLISTALRDGSAAA